MEIRGQILDLETKKPIQFATVMIQGSKRGAVANEKGEFMIDKVCGKECVLICSSVGYKQLDHHHDIHHENLVIYMATEISVLESVVVEGESVEGDVKSLAVQRIDKAELSTKVTSSLASAIGEVQGVSFTSTGSNVQLPMIHGLYGNRILIINNGVKHGFQNWGTDHAPEIDITSADNITVIKGASGVRYGPEALGGVVVIEGNPLNLSESLYGNLNTGYQTNGRGYHFNGNLAQGFDKFSYHVGGNYFKVGDRHAPDYSLTNSGMEEISANVGFRYHLPKWDFKLYYSFIDQNLALLRSSVADSGDLFARSVSEDQPLFIRDFSYDINEPRQETNHQLAKLEIDWHSDFGKFSLIMGQQFNHRQEYDVRRSADLPIIDLDLFTTDTRLEWAHPKFLGLEGMAGVQFFYQDNNNNPGTNTTAFIPNYNTQRYSAYIIENIKRGRNLFELGIRLDHESNSVRGRETNQDLFTNDFSFTNFTATFGLVRELSTTWQFRSNIGSAWRTPNMAELYSFGQHGFKTQFGLWRYYTDEDGRLRTDRVLTEDDKEVKPERGYKWINELVHYKDDDMFAFTAYAHLIENFIYDRPYAVIGTIRGPMPVFIYDQVDGLFLGADITYSHKFSEDIRGIFGASYLWSQDIDDNQPLINQPPINIDADISWETPTFQGMAYSRLTLMTSYTFEQFQAPRTVTPDQLISGEVEITPDSEDFDFKDAPDGYFLSHFRWEWKLDGGLGGQIEVRNIFNTSYRDYLNEMRYFADEPGRNFLITINYKF